MPRAIQLACELIPHATETLAIKNPLGAKPVLIETFEAEITPNLRGEEFFPITHRCLPPLAVVLEVRVSTPDKMCLICRRRGG